MSESLYNELMEILNFDIAEFADNADYVQFLQSVKDQLEKECNGPFSE